jgi:hypothetical protein
MHTETIQTPNIWACHTSSMVRAALVPLFLAATLSLAQQSTDDRARLHPLAPQNANLKTGPEVGNRIPLFDLVDQNGKHQTFASLRGPRGLVLAFIRSADW